MEPHEDKLAVLIDADNVPYSNVKELLEEITKLGTPTIKRIYADWTRPALSGWKNVLLEHAITPIQQYSYTSGKNSSDSALIIDAMDILYAGRVNGFCIVSSDSDFTRLATRLREAGMRVYGFGEKKTPQAFISACHKFIYLEILKPEKAVILQDIVKKTSPVPEKSTTVIDPEIANLIVSCVNDLTDESGWAFLGNLGNYILKKMPNFDSRNYGFPKLFPLIKSLERFEIDEREEPNSNIRHIFLKVKKEVKPKSKKTKVS